MDFAFNNTWQYSALLLHQTSVVIKRNLLIVHYITEMLMSNRTNFVQWLKLQIRHCKKVNYPLSKITLHYCDWSEANNLSPSCSIILQLDSRNVRSTKWSVRKAIWQSQELPESNVHQLRTLSQNSFLKWLNVQTRHCKKFHCSLSKISLHCLTAYRWEASSL